MISDCDSNIYVNICDNSVAIGNSFLSMQIVNSQENLIYQETQVFITCEIIE